MHSNSHTQPSIHSSIHVKVKAKVKVKFSLQQATKVQRGVEVYFYSFFNLGATWDGWTTPRPGSLTLGKYTVLIV